jgi:CspA family cold shock protein
MIKEIKMSDEKFVGEVLWFDPKRGFGFIGWEKDGVKQKDLFAHFSDISCEGFKTLYKGQKVSFGLGVNVRGDPKATVIEVLKN